MAGLGHLDQIGRGRNLDRDVPGHEIGETCGGAMVGHRTHIDLGGAAEHHAQEMRQRTCAGNGVVRVRGIGLGPIDQILERLGVGLRPNRNTKIIHAQLAQRREIRDRVVVQVRVEVLIDRQRRDRRQQQGAAVGCRVFHHFDADAAVGTGAVLDDHRAAECATHFIGDQARHGIAGTTWREREDDADRLLAVLRLQRGGEKRSSQNRKHKRQQPPARHDASPCYRLSRR